MRSSAIHQFTQFVSTSLPNPDALDNIRHPEKLAAVAAENAMADVQSAADNQSQDSEALSNGHLSEINVSNPLIILAAACCCTLLTCSLIKYLFLGKLRDSEHQMLKRTLWEYFQDKGLFVLFILDTHSYEVRSYWMSWYMLLASLLLLSMISNQRLEYLAVSPSAKRWSIVKLFMLQSGLVAASVACLSYVTLSEPSPNRVFLITDISYATTFVTFVMWKFMISVYDMKKRSVWENKTATIYYTDLVQTLLLSIMELLRFTYLAFMSHAHIVIRVINLLRAHNLLTEIYKRYVKHQHYLHIMQLMDSYITMATEDEITRAKRECAICWERMDTARKLPCQHLFHSSCLRLWLEQDPSCPMCRKSLKVQAPQMDGLDYSRNRPLINATISISSNDESNSNDDSGDDISSDSEEEFIDARNTQRNHIFRFDTARYTNNPILSWLPTISIEGFM